MKSLLILGAGGFGQMVKETAVSYTHLSFWLILGKMKGECIMKQVLIIAVVAIIAAVNFVMYCCLRVASQEDQMLEKLSRRKESESDGD